MPISRVRSETETSIIFMIPMPPTNREIPAMATSTTIMVSIMVFIMSSISAEVITI